MNLAAALALIADRFGLDADELCAYADEDTVGGFHPDERRSKWPGGSIWEVEGKVIYALARHKHPRLMLNLGGWKGCSTAHLMAALIENQFGTLGSVDLYPEPRVESWSRFEDRLTRFTTDGVKFVEAMPANEYDFCFEDMYHSYDQVVRVWSAFVAKAPPGSWMISHDSEHNPIPGDAAYNDGAVVRAAIESVVGDDYLSVLIEPSDCGLACWRKP